MAGLGLCFDIEVGIIKSDAHVNNMAMVSV